MHAKDTNIFKCGSNAFQNKSHYLPKMLFKKEFSSVLKNLHRFRDLRFGGRWD
ncbi:hypothetical protein P872_00820 [Rhodonellum psychrophilum GCM71 = DSM 17998]|uniref:Uncharacterized protein n=1 Tax=Rhodonellum psychrophilum GCM71 = DSM 17998 TaxID=1123057 RepID=U5C2P6_9BACT|nr:hypothetical protein P872_00820 [Rhodonellum psychrophilum GCM71 = DSM 17998]